MAKGSSNVQRNNMLSIVRTYADKEFTLSDIVDRMNPTRRMTQQQMSATLKMSGYIAVSVNVWRRKE